MCTFTTEVDDSNHMKVNSFNGRIGHYEVSGAVNLRHNYEFAEMAYGGTLCNKALCSYWLIIVLVHSYLSYFGLSYQLNHY